MILFRSRTGQPMETLEWAKAFEDESIRIVERTQVGPIWVSTIWEGIVTPGKGIFDTAIIGADGLIIDQWSTDTEEDARAMHAQIVAEQSGDAPGEG